MTSKAGYFLIPLVLCLCVLANAKTRQLAKHVKKAEFVCVTGQRYQENKCNYCDCINGALAGCSRTDCDKLPFNYMARNCTIGSKWQEECNSCSCVKQYGTVCTAKQCVAKKASSKKVDPKVRAGYLVKDKGPKFRNMHNRIPKGTPTVVHA